MSPTPSPFGSNPRRYRNVPKRVKNPKTQSGCFIEAAVLVTAALGTLLII